MGSRVRLARDWLCDHGPLLCSMDPFAGFVSSKQMAFGPRVWSKSCRVFPNSANSGSCAVGASLSVLSVG